MLFCTVTFVLRLYVITFSFFLVSLLFPSLSIDMHYRSVHSFFKPSNGALNSNRSLFLKYSLLCEWDTFISYSLLSICTRSYVNVEIPRIIKRLMSPLDHLKWCKIFHNVYYHYLFLSVDQYLATVHIFKMIINFILEKLFYSRNFHYYCKHCFAFHRI